MGCDDLNPFLQMKKLRQQKFNDLPRSKLVNDGSVTQAQVPQVKFLFSPWQGKDVWYQFHSEQE